MKNKLLILKSLLLLFLITSCSDDNNGGITTDFVVAFEKASISFETADDKKNVKLVFSRPATENGTIKITYNASNAEYGADKDFTTLPQADTSGIIVLTVKKGDSGTSFEFNKLKNPVEGTSKSVNFSITNINIPFSKIQGNTNLAVSFTSSASLGGSFTPEIGGPNEPNQVYIDLSSETQTAVKRDTWDLAFYSGDDFRVKLNGAIFMAAAQLETADINSVTEADVKDLKQSVATKVAGSAGYLDDPSGDILKTTIAEVSANESDNKVYLLNLGFKVSDKQPNNVGGVKLEGPLRGWKKIRILRSRNGYKLQYSDINDTTFEEITIPKDTDYNFTFFSFDTKNSLKIEPQKKQWDLCFTPFTNILSFGPGGLGGYGYSDFVVNNIYGGVKAYMVEDKTKDAYKNFKLSDVDNAKFSNDQRAIGSNWRVGGGPGRLPSLKNNVFFVLKDAEGNIYKIKFTALFDENGVRGHSKFEYTLLK